MDRIGEYTSRTPAQKTHRSVTMSRRRETQDAEHLSSLPKCVVVPCDESQLRLHGKETKETKFETNTFLALAGASVASTENSDEPLRVLCTFAKIIARWAGKNIACVCVAS